MPATVSSDDSLELALPRPAAPASTQSHGTVLAAVFAGFVVLAVLLWLTVRDVGPFDTTLVGTQITGDTHQVSIEVTNKGDRAGRANCQVLFIEGLDARPHQNFQTQRIEGGATLKQTVDLTADADWRVTEVRCR